MKRSEAVLIINKIIANKETAEEILEKLEFAGLIDYDWDREEPIFVPENENSVDYYSFEDAVRT